MPENSFQILTADGLTLRGMDWQPSRKARAAICLIHGIGEHIGRYAHVVAALNQAAFAVVGVDLRGHGTSDGPRGVIPSFDAFLDDMDLMLSEAGRRYAGVPIVLYGHSLGGLLVLYYPLKRQVKAAGVVASSPQLRLGFKPPAWKTAMGRLLFNLWPSFNMPSGLDQSALSHDPQVVRAYASDPLVHDRVSPRLGIGLIDLGQWVLDHAAEFSLPLLVFNGSRDRLISPEACQELTDKVPGDCTHKVWENLFHETHNEPQKAEVIAYMIEWIKAHTR